MPFRSARLKRIVKRFVRPKPGKTEPGEVSQVHDIKRNNEIQRLKTIFQQSPIGIMIHDRNGRLVEMNNASLEILGVSSPEKMKDFSLFNDPNIPLEAKKRLKRGETVTPKGSYSFEKIKERKLYETMKSGTVSLSVLMSPLFQEGKEEPVGYLAQIQDITEQEMMTEALRRERDRLGRIMETSPVGITMVNREGRIIFANTRAEQILGLTKDEVRRQKCNILTWKITDLEGDPIPEEGLVFRQVMSTAQPVYNVRHAIQRADGSKVVLSVNGSPLLDKSGSVDAAVCIFEDISELIKAEEMLRQDQQKTQRLIDSNVVGIIVSDLEKGIEVNDEFLRITGYQDKDLREGRIKLREMVPPEFREVDDRCLNEMEARIDGKCLPYEMELICKDGRRVPIGIGRVLLTKKPFTYVSFILDLREQKKAEEKIVSLNEDLKRRTAELEATNKGLEAFTYSVSHDLRNPLIGIQKLSALLSERYSEPLDAKGRRFLSIIQSETRNMLQLIADLLELSRFERQEIKGTLIDMTQLAREVFAEMRSTIPDRKLQLKIGPLPAAQGDPIMIRQVMRNLLSNAAKFTISRKTALVDIGGRTEGDRVIYSVQDNGVGFDMRYADRLFTIFQRLHSKDQFEGTGVGLAIVHRIITRHGGRVWAEGRIDEGATFYFTLPIGFPERREDKSQTGDIETSVARQVSSLQF